MKTLVLLVPPLLLAACGESEREPVLDATVDTIADLEIVTSRGVDVPLAWAIDTSAAVVIGTLDGPDVTRFGRLTGVALSPSAKVYVADGHALAIRVFNPDGTFLRSVGREGEGPGEFKSIDGIAHSPDGAAFYARDPLLNRVSVFDSSGVFQHSFLLSRPFAQLARRTSLWTDAAGRLYDLTQLGTTPSVDSIGVVAYDSSGQVLDTTLVAATVPSRLLLVGSNGLPRAAALLPFGAFPRAAVSLDGRVVGGTGREYVVDVFEDGTTIRRIAKDESAIPVPSWAPDTVAAIAGRLRENDPAGSIQQDPLATNQPFFNFLLVDAAGYTWVAREGLEYLPASRYDVFDQQGRFIGSMSLPSILLDEVGLDYLVGRQVDDLGVEQVVVFPLTRRSEPST